MNLKKNLFALGGFAGGALLCLAINAAVGSNSASVVNGVKTLDSTQPPASQPTKLNSSSTKTVTKLAPPAKRTVFVYGEIAENSAAIAAQITKLGQTDEPIYVVLNSPGGSVLDGAMIATAIENAKGPVYTVCNQLCASMAAIIFEYGTERYIVDRSFLMFHPASGGMSGEVDTMSSRLNSIQRYIGKMEANIAKRSGHTFEEYKHFAAKELWIDGEDSVNNGYADKLVALVLPEAEKSGENKDASNRSGGRHTVVGPGGITTLYWGAPTTFSEMLKVR